MKSVFPSVCRVIAVAMAFGPFVGESAAREPDRDQALEVMKRATTYMVEELSREGGYVWTYFPDRSRSWEEMEVTPTIISVQSRGTPMMGSVFLDAYRATGDEYYYGAACGAADALIRIQHESGGWNYIGDLAGEESLRDWYETVGRSGWRLEEFQHYYGNATFDDETTIGAARFMMRMFLEKKDPRYEASFGRALQFVLDAQYSSGGWPQRFPLMAGFSKQGRPDYSGFVTFNDDVAIANVDFLIECLNTLGDERLREPIRRAMDSFLRTLQEAPQAGWAMQYTPELVPAGARSYEPKALSTKTTAQNVGHLIRFYYLTGDRTFLERIPEAFDWLDTVRLAGKANRGEAVYPTFIEVGTNRPLYLHRRGSNVWNGEYFTSDDPEGTIGHYSSVRSFDLEELRKQYAKALATPPEEAVKGSPLLGRKGGELLADSRSASRGGDRRDVGEIIGGLSEAGYWASPLLGDSHPFKAGPAPEVADGDYSTTFVGDDYDTSPFEGPLREGGCIKTSVFARNMTELIQFLER